MFKTVSYIDIGFVIIAVKIYCIQLLRAIFYSVFEIHSIGKANLFVPSFFDDLFFLSQAIGISVRFILNVTWGNVISFVVEVICASPSSRATLPGPL